jgi:hypothetical protein
VVRPLRRTATSQMLRRGREGAKGGMGWGRWAAHGERVRGWDAPAARRGGRAPGLRRRARAGARAPAGPPGRAELPQQRLDAVGHAPRRCAGGRAARRAAAARRARRRAACGRALRRLGSGAALVWPRAALPRRDAHGGGGRPRRSAGALARNRGLTEGRRTVLACSQARCAALACPRPAVLRGLGPFPRVSPARTRRWGRRRALGIETERPGGRCGPKSPAPARPPARRRGARAVAAGDDGRRQGGGRRRAAAPPPHLPLPPSFPARRRVYTAACPQPLRLDRRHATGSLYLSYLGGWGVGRGGDETNAAGCKGRESRQQRPGARRGDPGAGARRAKAALARPRPPASPQGALTAARCAPSACGATGGGGRRA